MTLRTLAAAALPPPRHGGGPRISMRARGIAVGGAVVIHLAAIVVIVGVQRPTPLPMVPAPEPPLVLKLTPPTALPQPQRRQVARPVVRPPDEPTLKPAPHPDFTLRENQPTPARARARAPAEPTSEARPALATPTGDTETVVPIAGAEDTVADARERWEGKVFALLEKAKRFPAAARWSGAQDVVLVRIVVGRDGVVTDTKILRSHHFAPLDQEARDLPRRVSPLPPPPAEIPESPVVLTVPIEFYLTKQ